MKKYLVCTDFSESSENCVIYAAEMAARTGAEIVIFHAFFLAVVPNGNFVPEAYNIEVSSQQKSALEKRMSSSAKNLTEKYTYSDGNPLKVSALTLNGIADIEIVQTAKKQAFDLIIIGSKGENAFSRFFFGSVADELYAANLPCPLLAVPKQSSFNPAAQIVFAGQKDEGDIPAVMQLESFASSFAKNIIYLSVNKLGEEIFDLPDRFQSLSGVDFAEISAGSVEAGIHNFVREINADLLVMHKHEKSFFESLSQVSHTEEMLHSAALPLLIYKDYL